MKANNNRQSGAIPCEEWRLIPDHPCYEVSSEGNVRRSAPGKGTRAGKPRVPHKLPNGYLVVDLWEGGERFHVYVHRAVALAFVGPAPTALHEAAHNNGDKSDNRAENLRWATHKENEADKIGHGTLMRGSGHSNSKITESDVRKIRERRSNGETLTAIARDFNINFQNVGLICQGKTWSHI